MPIRVVRQATNELINLGIFGHNLFVSSLLQPLRQPAKHGPAQNSTNLEVRRTHKKSGVPLHTAENKTHSIV